jgi:glycosyltransferase involved in cell wall biosynthesis
MTEDTKPFDSSHPLSETWICLVSYTWRDEKGLASHIAGPPQDLYKYLKTRAKGVVFIEQPQSYCPDITPTMTICEEGLEKKIVRFPMLWFPYKNARADIQQSPLPYVVFKVRDILSTLYFLLLLRRTFDFYIGVEAVNTIIGLWLQKLRIVGKVVYDVIDYSPQRFENKKLNKIFHSMDRYCVHRASWSWVQSRRTKPMRIKLGASPDKIGPHILKPSGYGGDPSMIRFSSTDNFNPYQIVYVGAIHPTDGVDCLIESMPHILKKIPKANLIVVGDGIDAPKLLSRVQQLKVENNVKFLGTIGDPKKVEDLLLSSAIGIAPYKKDVLSLKYFNDPSKPRLYLGCGLPVIITDVPEVAKEIHDRKAGISIAWDPVSLSDAAISLLTDKSLLNEYRANSLEMAKGFTWDSIFNKIFSQMIK